MNQTPASQSPTYESTGGTTPAARLADMLNSMRGGPASGVKLWYDSDGYIFGIDPEDRPEWTWPTTIPYADEPEITRELAQKLIDLARLREEANR